MRVAIITLPLHTNYGGILQAYALKKAVESLGHTAEVLDRKCKLVLPPSWKMPLVYVKRTAQNVVALKKVREVFRERRIMRELPYVGTHLLRFIGTGISPREIDGFDEIGMGEYDAFIVGSDQVWRPKYFGKIEDAFLAFTRDWPVKRIAYAASFGTEQLEYTYEQLESCSALLHKFDAVSVRESGAVALCDEWFDCEKVSHVLDPVMLLQADAYRKIASESSERPAKGKLLTYVLDRDMTKDFVIEKVKGWLSCDVHDAFVDERNGVIPVQNRIVPSMEQWLSCFIDAEFVVTDSFHGTLLSILFHKPFISLGNPKRGMSRLLSILEAFGLQDRLIHGIDSEDDGEYYVSGIDWDAVEDKLKSYREDSFEFLRKSLK